MTGVRRKNEFWSGKNRRITDPLHSSRSGGGGTWRLAKQTSTKMEIWDLFKKFQLYHVFQSPRHPGKGKNIILGRNTPLTIQSTCTFVFLALHIENACLFAFQAFKQTLHSSTSPWLVNLQICYSGKYLKIYEYEYIYDHENKYDNYASIIVITARYIK